MSTSRKIVVVKKDGFKEPFDQGKLASSIWKGISRTGRNYRDAMALSRAIFVYLQRKAVAEVSSHEVGVLMLRALKKVGMGDGGVVIELHSILRNEHRSEFVVIHTNGSSTTWDKSWVALLVSQMWHISRNVARIIAGEIEMELLEQNGRMIHRDEVVARLNDKVSQYGLADAVPAWQYEMED